MSFTEVSFVCNVQSNTNLVFHELLELKQLWVDCKGVTPVMNFNQCLDQFNVLPVTEKCFIMKIALRWFKTSIFEAAVGARLLSE